MPSTEQSDSTAFIHARPGVLVAGQARADLSDAIESADIHLPLHGRAHAELRLINWSSANFSFSELRLGDTLELVLGESAESPGFIGEITGIEENYGDGAPKLVLLLEDKLHKLARQRHNRRFESMTINDVIAQVLEQSDLDFDTDVSSTSATWLQLNESNLAFLMRLVAPYGIGLRLEQGRLRARAEDDDAEPIALNPDHGTAKNVRIVTDLNHQSSSIRVQGHDLSSGESVSHQATGLRPSPAGTTAIDELSRLGWQTDSVIPHPFARRQSEAEGFANGQFERSAARFLYGEILCAGTPALRSGREVELSGVSPRLTGRYRVSDCVHQFGGAGYLTRIKVQKADQT